MKSKITESLLKSIPVAEKSYWIYDSELTGFAIIIRPSGVHTFCLKYRNPEGQKKSYTIGKYRQLTVKQARDAARGLNGQIANQHDVQSLKVSRRAIVARERHQTLKVFFEERYRPYLLAELKRGKERAYLIDHYFVQHWGEKGLSDINEWLVSGWRQQHLKRGLKPAGVNRPASALKALLNKAVKWSVIDSNPIADLKPVHEDPNPIVRHLSEAEENDLRAALEARQNIQRDERDRFNSWKKSRHMENLRCLRDKKYTDHLMPMVLTVLNTGMRRGEIFNLQTRDIDLSRKSLVIRGEGAKSGITRHIPLNAEAFRVLTTWCNQENPERLVFPSPITGQRFDNISTAWRRLIRLAELEDFRFHDLRHTFASKLVMRGADLYTVKDLLGHQSIETTQRYAHLAPEHKARAVELLNV